MNELDFFKSIAQKAFKEETNGKEIEKPNPGSIENSNPDSGGNSTVNGENSNPPTPNPPKEGEGERGENPSSNMSADRYIKSESRSPLPSPTSTEELAKRVSLALQSLEKIDSKELIRKLDRINKKLHEYIKLIAGEDFPVLERLRTQLRQSLVEVAITKEKLTPLEFFNKLRELAAEEGLEEVVVWDEEGNVQVKKENTGGEGEPAVYYEYGGARVEVSFDLSPLPSVKSRRMALVVVPFNKFESLKSLVYVAGKGEEVDYSVEELVAAAVRAGASDVHLIPKEDGVYVFFRINQVYVPQPKYFLTHPKWEVFRRLLEKEINDTSPIPTDDFLIIKEGKADFPNLGVSIRYVYIPDGHSRKYGEQVFRILRKESVPARLSLEERLAKLGYDEETIEVLSLIIKLRGCLVVISGRTNSGKSTLLAQLIASIPPDKKVATIEDPIEYTYSAPNIVQHQVFIPPNSNKQIGFPEYVKAFKRADTDVVLVGEWRRSQGLTEAMVEQAQAGQLIFTTLHIASAFSIYHSLYDIFGVPFNISTNLIRFSLNQNLAKKLCPHCSESEKIYFTDKELSLFQNLTESEREKLASFKVEGRKKGKGCPHCGGSGYAGVFPIYEYFTPTEEVVEGVKRGELSPIQIKTLLEEKASRGGVIYRSKVDRALEALEKGLISKEEAMAVF